jgi:hypothetical protein
MSARLGSAVGYPKGVCMVKRLALAATTVVVLLFPATATAGGWETTVEEFPADFVMSSETCPNLPEGTTITGTGTGTSVTKTKTDRRGTTTVFNSSIAHSRASDQAGNRYRFLYSNQFLVSKTASQSLFTGRMVDLFVLQGDGPARLRNGFVANITTDLGDLFLFDPILEFGDPINFETGEAICDPL